MQGYNILAKFLMMPGGITGSDTSVDALELSWFRTVINLCVTFFVMKVWFKVQLNGLPTYFYRLMLVKSVIGSVGFLAMTVSMQYLPISLFYIIISLSPFLISVLSYLFLGETLHRREFVGLFVSFSGILILMSA